MARMHFVKPLGVAGHNVLVHEGAYAGAEGFYFLAVAEVHDVFPMFGLGVVCSVFGVWYFVRERWCWVFALALASALCLRASGVAGQCFGLCSGIRVMPSCFKRRPCAGRHLLFFAAAKKSRQ
ncbi:hypothetical protein, partial [Paraburkholderia terrae]|uniref:hypothetical protein n=1 Tax=Paraburkholderia terrae TaxID=311230 RepID=UPI001C3F22B3